MVTLAKENGEIRELVFFCTRCHRLSLFGLTCGRCKGHNTIRVKMHLSVSERRAFHRLLVDDRH